MSETATRELPRPWAIEAEVRYRITAEDFISWPMFRRFLIDWEIEVRREHRRRKCWWPHIWISVLGLSTDLGLYVDRG